MKIRRLQMLVALIAGTVIVVVAALPSGALTGNVSSGILTIGLSPQLASSLDPGSAPCRGSGSGTLDLVATTLTISDPFTYSGDTYFLEYTAEAPITLSAGTMSMGPIYTSSMVIYPETSPDSCTPDLDDPLCEIAPYAFGYLTLSGPWTGTTATLSGSSTVRGWWCYPPFGGFSTTRTLTITNMVVDF